MDTLWAPWRSDYVGGKKDGACIFCEASKGAPENHKDDLILFKGAVSTVMLNKYPYNNGHLMISPVRHIALIDAMSPEESIDMFRLLRHCCASLTKTFSPEGFNIGMNVGKASGAGFGDHLHMHVVPRWNGDCNFMPVLADVRVMPEHIAETYSKLKPYFERI